VTEVIFFIAALGAIAGAIGVVALRNPFYSVLALVCHLLALAALFLGLQAQFVAAAQVVVYAGAVMVLYVFVVSYIGGAEQVIRSPGPGLRVTAAVFVGVLFVELSIAMLGSGLKAVSTDGPGLNADYGQPEQIGELLLTKFLLPFEVASFLLLIAAVGAVVLARRRRGLDPEPPADALTAGDLVRRPAPGTMAEGVGTRSILTEQDEADQAAGRTPIGKGGW